MRDFRRWKENSTRWIVLLVGTVVVIAVVVPTVAYFSTLGNPSSKSSDSQPRTTSTSSRTPTSFRTSTSTRSPTTTSIPAFRTTSTTTITASSVGSAVPTQDLAEIERQLLIRHNKLRALHGAPNMTWNDELTRFAANYAATNFSCANVKLIHSGGPYGENLAAGYVGGEAAVDAWYNEIKLYNYSNPVFSEETGHFTQLIWDESVELGCAIVMCDNAWQQYTICEYYPQGNIVGSDDAGTRNIFSEHVKPLLNG